MSPMKLDLTNALVVAAIGAVYTLFCICVLRFTGGRLD